MVDEYEVNYHTKKPKHYGKIIITSAADEFEARRIARKALRKRFKYDGLVIDKVYIFKHIKTEG